MAICGSNLFGAAQTTASRSCAVAIVVCGAVFSWADKPPAAQPGGPGVVGDPDDRVNPYSKLSNEQLGTLAGTFEDLDRDQRRWFLTEVRKRMSRKGEGPQIEADRNERFGRVVSEVGDADPSPGETRKPGGAAPPGDERADTTKVYGTGLKPEAEETADVSTPALKSEDPAKPSE